MGTSFIHNSSSKIKLKNYLMVSQSGDFLNNSPVNDKNNYFERWERERMKKDAGDGDD